MTTQENNKQDYWFITHNLWKGITFFFYKTWQQNNFAHLKNIYWRRVTEYYFTPVPPQKKNLNKIHKVKQNLR